MLEYRDRQVANLGVRLVLGSVQQDIAARSSNNRSPAPPATACRPTRSCGCCRRTASTPSSAAGALEEKARAKERIFSLRDEFGQWDPRAQRPEPWNLYNTRHHPGEHFRVVPLSNWTELDIWQYVEQQDLELPSIYFAHKRTVSAAAACCSPSVSGLGRARTWRTSNPFEAVVRYRTVGDMTCTAAIESKASTPAEIIVETSISRVSERGATRADDRFSEVAMEDRKREG